MAADVCVGVVAVDVSVLLLGKATRLCLPLGALSLSLTHKHILSHTHMLMLSLPLSHLLSHFLLLTLSLTLTHLISISLLALDKALCSFR